MNDIERFHYEFAKSQAANKPEHVIDLQHRIFLTVLLEWERSRLPWKRWFAEKFHNELIDRVILAEKLRGG